MASWFETARTRLLTMRVQDITLSPRALDLILTSGHQAASRRMKATALQEKPGPEKMQEFES